MSSDNIMYSMVLLPILMSVLTQFITRLEYINFQKLYDAIKNFQWYHLFYKQYSVVLKGERIRNVCQYSGEVTIVESFTDTFRALWNYLVEDMNENIIEITETNVSSNEYKKKTNGFFYVSQPTIFLIDYELQLYGKTHNDTEVIERKNTNGSCRSDIITIELFSYTSNVDTIKQFLFKLTNNYKTIVKTEREKSKFIYSIKNTSEEEGYYDCWSEIEFNTTRTFDNFFFDKKDFFLKKLDFFIHNKQWYYDKGIPYTIGIGLSGQPGTGKTSLIKCIAKYTNRHIINLSMKLFKTRKELYRFYYENTYNRNNEKNSIGFDKKIIVIEDIDCLGDIVWKRELQKPKSPKSVISSDIINPQKIDENDGVMKTSKLLLNSDPITLDDILNIWDGINETPGRILIMTSNHYDKLDPALVRPGRIDVKLEMSCLSKESVMKIFEHLYGKLVPRKHISSIPDKKLTPAKLMNIYINNQQSETQFLRELIK